MLGKCRRTERPKHQRVGRVSGNLREIAGEQDDQPWWWTSLTFTISLNCRADQVMTQVTKNSFINLTRATLARSILSLHAAWHYLWPIHGDLGQGVGGGGARLGEAAGVRCRAWQSSCYHGRTFNYKTTNLSHPGPHSRPGGRTDSWQSTGA